MGNRSEVRTEERKRGEREREREREREQTEQQRLKSEESKGSIFETENVGRKELLTNE